MGYRQVPLGRRLGPAFDGGHARVRMDSAECFMYFVAGMQRLFASGDLLVVEGAGLDPEVESLYRSRPARPVPAALARVRPSGTRLCLELGPALTRPLNALAARKTYAQIGERMWVFDPGGKLLMDGSRLGERLVLFAAGLGEARVRRFAAGPLAGVVEWVPAPG